MGMFSIDAGKGPSQTTSTVNTTASGTGKNIRGVNSNYTESGAIGVGTNAKYQEQGSIDASKGGKVKVLAGKAKDQSANKGTINEAGSTNLGGNQGTIQIGDNGAGVKAVSDSWSDAFKIIAGRQGDALQQAIQSQSSFSQSAAPAAPQAWPMAADASTPALSAAAAGTRAASGSSLVWIGLILFSALGLFLFFKKRRA
jgi:LPXTG-motif cell wall-anchored protein